MDINYAQPCDIEHMMKEIIIMTELEHDNIVRYIGCDLNMTKKEVRPHAAQPSLSEFHNNRHTCYSDSYVHGALFWYSQRRHGQQIPGKKTIW